MPVHKHIDSCSVHCSIGTIYVEFEKKYGRGCDLVIIDKNKKIICLIEAKRGNITVSDVNDARDQLNYAEQQLQDRYVGYKFMKIFLHCRRGRFDSRAVAKLSKEGIIKVYSGEDIAKEIL